MHNVINQVNSEACRGVVGLNMYMGIPVDELSLSHFRSFPRLQTEIGFLLSRVLLFYSVKGAVIYCGIVIDGNNALI